MEGKENRKKYRHKTLVMSPVNLSLFEEVKAERIDQSEKDSLALGEYAFFIKNTFGLNVNDFSKILGISKTTAYKYLDGCVPESSSETIEHLYSLAKLWESKVGNLKLGMELKRLYKGRSLYELLVSGEHDSLKDQIEKVAKVVNARKESADKSLVGGAIRYNPDIVRHSVS